MTASDNWWEIFIVAFAAIAFAWFVLFAVDIAKRYILPTAKADFSSRDTIGSDMGGQPTEDRHLDCAICDGNPDVHDWAASQARTYVECDHRTPERFGYNGRCLRCARTPEQIRRDFVTGTISPGTLERITRFDQRRWPVAQVEAAQEAFAELGDTAVTAHTAINRFGEVLAAAGEQARESIEQQTRELVDEMLRRGSSEQIARSLFLQAQTQVGEPVPGAHPHERDRRESLRITPESRSVFDRNLDDGIEQRELAAWRDGDLHFDSVPPRRKITLED